MKKNMYVFFCVAMHACMHVGAPKCRQASGEMGPI